MNRGLARVVMVAAVAAAPASAVAQVSVIQTKHNLSASGPGDIKSESETRVCKFCHIDHSDDVPTTDRASDYTPYVSTTMVSETPGGITGATRTCLTCHDGTIAPTVGEAGALTRARPAGAVAGIALAAKSLGLDLRTSHPVSFVPAASGQLRAPEPNDVVKLDASGQLQCTSCHDPHTNRAPAAGNFLIKDTRASELCLTCHASTYWQSSDTSHQSSTKTYDTADGAHTAYATVADNGCASCHRQHGAATTSHLLKSPGAEVCLQCHAGQVAAKNIFADLGKNYTHPVLDPDAQRHDAAEGPNNAEHTLPEKSASAPRHVTCVDCHNPHASTPQSAIAPRVSGALYGVWGMSRSGTKVEAAENEYEVCFKCHADSANQPAVVDSSDLDRVEREIPDPDLRSRFDVNGPSFHPVMGPGRNPDVPGLIAPLTESSSIYCSDCHSSNAAGRTAGSRGPHGSIYEHILTDNYETSDFTTETTNAYGLCYRCHDRDVLMSSKSGFPEHRRHVREQSSPCSACHDVHGVSSIQGTETNNAHLINFDVKIVKRNSQRRRVYTSIGARAGTCSLSCHDKEHVDASYSPGKRDARRNLLLDPP